MWSNRFVLCLMLMVSTTTFALPTAKIDNESDAQKPQPISTFDLIEMPVDEKPTDYSKPNEIAVDPKPIDVKPTEQTKPNELPSASSSPMASGLSGTFLETIPLNAGPPRRQFLYDQRQDGKYNIRADLENFVILVVPSSGNSLLDLLKRSGQRQPQHHNKRTQQTKHHKKYHPSSSSSSSSSLSGKTVEVKKTSNRSDYLNGEEAPSVEFIEGRTPYHVDIQSDEILQPNAYASNGVRSLTNGAATTIADLPLVNLDDNNASMSGIADSAILLSTVTGKQEQQPNLSTMPSTTSNKVSSPRLPKSITIDGYGNPFTNLNTVLLTPKIAYGNDQLVVDHLNKHKNYNNYFSQKPSVQIVNRNVQNDDVVDSTNLLNTVSTSKLFDLTDSKNSFNSLNVGNIDRLALAGDGTTKIDADLANSQWELTLLGAEEQCGPDRRRDSYGVCQFVPADYATS